MTQPASAATECLWPFQRPRGTTGLTRKCRLDVNPPTRIAWDGDPLALLYVDAAVLSALRTTTWQAVASPQQCGGKSKRIACCLDYGLFCEHCKHKLTSVRFVHYALRERSYACFRSVASEAPLRAESTYRACCTITIVALRGVLWHTEGFGHSSLCEHACRRTRNVGCGRRDYVERCHEPLTWQQAWRDALLKVLWMRKIELHCCECRPASGCAVPRICETS